MKRAIIKHLKKVEIKIKRKREKDIKQKETK